MQELNKKVKKNLFMILFAILILLIIIVNIMKYNKKNNLVEVKETNITNDPITTEEEKIENAKKKTSTNEIKYNDYIYKVSYIYNNSCNIYYLIDENIYSVCQLYDINNNKIYEETKHNFSDSAKNIIKQIFQDLLLKSNSKDIDASYMSLQENEKRFLNWILLDNENAITYEKNLIIESEEEQVTDARGKIIFTNSKKTIKKSDNEIVNKIASYINNFIDTLYDKESTNSMTASLKSNKVTGIHIDITNTYIGDNIVSFKIVINGYTDKKIDDIKGYTFDLKTGDISSITESYRTIISSEVIKSFNKSDVYKKYKDKLPYNYPNYINSIIYNPGNSYIDENNINFIIPNGSLGVPNDTIIIPIYNNYIN